MSDILELKYAGTVHCMGCALKLATLMHECKAERITSELIETDNAIILIGNHTGGGIKTSVTAFLATMTESGTDIPVYTISEAISDLVQEGMRMLKIVEAQTMQEAGDIINKIKQQAH